jgi:hypothetical protein
MIYGAQRLLSDLTALGYQAELTTVGGNTYAIIHNYEVEMGRFQGRIIDLGFMAMADFPRTVASAIHVRANPQLLEKSDTVPNVRNIIDSPLGGEWRYWSHNFQWNVERNARRLMSQINGIFKNA